MSAALRAAGARQAQVRRGDGRRAGWTGALTRSWARHPEAGLAVRAACSAAIAWALTQGVPSPLGDYPYYAPFGAVVVTSGTLAGSARVAGQTITAIAIGAALALGLGELGGPTIVPLTLVVAAGMLVSVWGRLGSARTWVPTTGLFVLILGDENPMHYVLGYAGLTFLGAAVGLGVLAVFPPLPLAPARLRLVRLQDTLVSQLRALADGLQQEHPPTEDEWRRRMHTIDPLLADMRSAVRAIDQARQGNRRARRYRWEAARQYTRARALENLSLLVEDLTMLIAGTETADRESTALGPALRGPAARALDRLADVLSSVEEGTADPPTTRDARAALEALTDEVRRARRSTDDDLLVASTVVVGIRRCLTAVEPPELTRDEAVDAGA